MKKNIVLANTNQSSEKSIPTPKTALLPKSNHTTTEKNTELIKSRNNHEIYSQKRIRLKNRSNSVSQSYSSNNFQEGSFLLQPKSDSQVTTANSTRKIQQSPKIINISTDKIISNPALRTMNDQQMRFLENKLKTFKQSSPPDEYRSNEITQNLFNEVQQQSFKSKSPNSKINQKNQKDRSSVDSFDAKYYHKAKLGHQTSPRKINKISFLKFQSPLEKSSEIPFAPSGLNKITVPYGFKESAEESPSAKKMVIKASQKFTFQDLPKQVNPSKNSTTKVITSSKILQKGPNHSTANIVEIEASCHSKGQKIENTEKSEASPPLIHNISKFRPHTIEKTNNLLSTSPQKNAYARKSKYLKSTFTDNHKSYCGDRSFQKQANDLENYYQLGKSFIENHDNDSYDLLMNDWKNKKLNNWHSNDEIYGRYDYKYQQLRKMKKLEQTKQESFIQKEKQNAPTAALYQKKFAFVKKQPFHVRYESSDYKTILKFKKAVIPYNGLVNGKHKKIDNKHIQIPIDFSDFDLDNNGGEISMPNYTNLKHCKIEDSLYFKNSDNMVSTRKKTESPMKVHNTSKMDKDEHNKSIEECGDEMPTSYIKINKITDGNQSYSESSKIKETESLPIKNLIPDNPDPMSKSNRIIEKRGISRDTYEEGKKREKEISEDWEFFQKLADQINKGTQDSQKKNEVDSTQQNTRNPDQGGPNSRYKNSHKRFDTIRDKVDGYVSAKGGSDYFGGDDFTVQKKISLIAMLKNNLISDNSSNSPMVRIFGKDNGPIHLSNSKRKIKSKFINKSRIANPVNSDKRSSITISNKSSTGIGGGSGPGQSTENPSKYINKKTPGLNVDQSKRSSSHPRSNLQSNVPLGVLKRKAILGVNPSKEELPSSSNISSKVNSKEEIPNSSNINSLKRKSNLSMKTPKSKKISYNVDLTCNVDTDLRKNHMSRSDLNFVVPTKSNKSISTKKEAMAQVVDDNPYLKYANNSAHVHRNSAQKQGRAEMISSQRISNKKANSKGLSFQSFNELEEDQKVANIQKLGESKISSECETLAKHNDKVPSIECFSKFN